MTHTAAAEATPGPLTHRQILTILSGLMAGMFLASLDQTIVATAIRTIADDLQGLSIQAWATTAYLITATISTPLYGKLSDIYGRKPFFLAAISIFIFGSLLCGFAQSMYDLAAFRALQGLGAGGLFSLALAIIGDIVPPRERAKYQGYFVAVFGTSSVLGPVVGGFLAGTGSILGITGWRWVFLVNVPIGLMALVLVTKVLNIEHVRRDHRIDWQGAIALVVGLVPLLVLTEQGREWGWTSPVSVTLAAVGTLGIIAFVLAEKAAGDEALLPLRMFRDRTFGIGSMLNFVIGLGMFGGLAALPLYLQIVKGATPTESGLLLLPMTAGIMSASIISGQAISRTGRYKVFPVFGSALLVVGALLLSRIGVDTPLWQTCVYMVVFGFGLGNNMQPLVLAVQNAVSPRDMGVATSSATFFRQMGGTLGTAVFLSILFSGAGSKITEAFARLSRTPDFQAALNDPATAENPANAPVLHMVETARAGGSASLPPGALDDSSFLAQMHPDLARPFLVGFAESIDVVLVVAAAILAVAFVLVLFLPELPLRLSSGMQAAHEERVADAKARQDAEDAAAVTGVATTAPGIEPPERDRPAGAASGAQA